MNQQTVNFVNGRTSQLDSEWMKTYLLFFGAEDSRMEVMCFETERIESLLAPESPCLWGDLEVHEKGQMCWCEGGRGIENRDDAY